MAAARRKGRKVVCGWEANGGFLLGSDVEREGKVLTALPTRDAFLPILAVLSASRSDGMNLTELFARLPKRYSKAALLRNFARENGRRLVEALSAQPPGALERLLGAPINRVDLTDGVRVLFANGEVVHFRPSGNADEFRIYAVADSQVRADAIVEAGIAEPSGVIRTLEREFIGAQ
jgi:phosphomannomutase